MITAKGTQTCSVTGQEYFDTPKNFTILELLQRGNFQGIIFRQNGTPHIDRQVKQLLRQHFTDAWLISRHFSKTWPPHLPDITPCDFWLWGFLKHNIYTRGPVSVEDLKNAEMGL